MRISEYMNPDVVTVTSDTPIEEAERIMRERHIRRLPVVDKSKLVGIVTKRTLQAARPSLATSLSVWESNYLLAKVKVHDVMERHVFTVTPDDPVEWAVKEAQRRGIGALVVVDKDKCDRVVGIATTTDLYQAAAQILGLGRQGAHLHIREPSRMGSLNDVIEIVCSCGTTIRSLVFSSYSPSGCQDPGAGHEFCFVNLDAGNADMIVKNLRERGYDVEASQEEEQHFSSPVRVR